MPYCQRRLQPTASMTYPPILKLPAEDPASHTMYSTLSIGRRDARSVANASVPKVIVNNTINLLFQTAISVLVISNHNSFRVLLTKLLPCILFENYIYIFALGMASSGNQHCANCIGTLFWGKHDTMCEAKWLRFIALLRCNVISWFKKMSARSTTD